MELLLYVDGLEGVCGWNCVLTGCRVELLFVSEYFCCGYFFRLIDFTE